MTVKSVRYSLIYQFFASQIRFGYYKKGDYLPAIELLCQVYHASPRTVRNAYLQLQTDGFIAVSSGRKTTVVYDATEEDCRRALRDYYLARKDAVRALDRAMTVLFLPLMREGCARLTRSDMRMIRESATQLEAGEFYISFFCGRAMVLALKNRLALDLFNELVSFFQFPHILARRGVNANGHLALRFHDLAGQAAAACDQNDREALFDVYLQIQTLMVGVLDEYLDWAGQRHPPQEQVPFRWGLYRDRPQLCYSLAARLLGRIYIDREFLPGDFLPTYSALTKDYAVSFSTVRRTAELLELLGVVSTAQGVGTWVVEPTIDPDRLRHPAVKKIVTMFREAVQIVQLAFDELSAGAAPLPAEEADVWLTRIWEQPGEDGAAAFAVCLFHLLRSQPGLAGVWETLREVLILGLPLLMAQSAESGSISPVEDELALAMEAGDVQALHARLRELTAQAAETARTLALRCLEAGQA